MHVTQHAKQRIDERTQLILEAVKELLTAENSVFLHSRNETVYRLFWSRPDNAFFIAVIDGTGAVITILNADFLWLPKGVRPTRAALIAAQQRAKKLQIPASTRHPQVEKFLKRYQLQKQSPA